MAALSVNTFLTQLRKSNLLNVPQLQAVHDFVEQTGDSVAPRKIAQNLVEQSALTSWQARMLLAGRTAFFLGKYKLLDLLGHGGMGAVFKAEQSPLGRIVAVKMMAEKLVDDEASVARFRREIQAAAALNHPNIVLAFDADCVRNTHFLVMEYVEGEDLGTLVKGKKRLPIGTACEYVRQAALGLQHAFEQGMVHRDIKPSNLLLRAEPREGPGPESGSPLSALRSPLIKVLDFGLAKFESELAEGGELTSTGQIIGTPDYISPEQAQDTKHADVRSDVYSLGCTLFRLLTGRVPFQGKNAMQKLMARTLNEAPPVRSLRSEIPPELDAVVRQMLARDPVQRFQTPADVAEALTPFAALTEDTPTIAWQPAADEIPQPPRKRSTPALDPGLAQFLNNLATEAAQDEQPAQEDVSTQSLAEVARPDATQASLLPPLPQGEGGGVRDRKPPLSRAGKKLQQQLQARRQAERRRLLWTLAAVAAFIACIAGYAAWRNAGQTTLIVDLPPEQRADVTLQVDGRQVRIPPTGPLESRRYPGLRSLRLIREGYEPIEETWTLSRGEEKVYKVHWIPTSATARNLELAALEQRVATLASRGVNPPGPDDSRPPAAAGGDEPRRSLDPDDPTVVQLRTDLLTFRRRHYAHPDVTIPAARLMSRLRWPADQLKRENIDPYELKAAESAGRGVHPPGQDGGVQPRRSPLPELVAILGDSRLKHWSPVHAVAFSPDGKLFATGGANNVIRLWDTDSLKEVGLLRGHTGDILAIAFSPDSHLLLSGGADSTVRLWRVKTGQQIHTLYHKTQGIAYVKFSPDQSVILTGLIGGSTWGGRTIWLWDSATGRLLHEINHQGSPYVVAAKFSPDSRYLLTARTEPTAHLWDIATGKELHRMVGHTNYLSSVTFCRGSHRAVTASADNTLKVWDVATGKELYTLTGHRAMVTSVAIFKDGSRAISGSLDSTIRLWDIDTGKQLQSWEMPNVYVHVLRLFPDERRVLFSINGQGMPPVTPRVLELGSGRVVGFPVKAVAVHLSTDSETLASLGVDGTVKLWDVETGEERIKTLPRLTGVAVSPDGRLLATGAADGTLRLWDLATGTLTKTLLGHDATILSLAFSPDGKMIASGSDDQTVRLWEPLSGKMLRTFEDHPNRVNSVDFSADGKFLASGSMHERPPLGFIYVWEVQTGAEYWSYSHPLNVTCVRFSPDAKTLAFGSYHVHTKELNSESPPEALLLSEGSPLHIASVAYAPDGRSIAFARNEDHGDTGRVAIWDLATRKKLGALKDYWSAVSCVTYSPDGELLATSATDGTVRLWDPKTGQTVHTVQLAPPGGVIGQVAFMPEGRHLVTANANGTVYVLRLKEWSREAEETEAKAVGTATRLSQSSTLDAEDDTSTKTPAKEPAGPPSPQLSGLLKLVDPAKHSVQGTWHILDGALSSPTLFFSVLTPYRLQIPYTPPEEYVLQAVVERKQGDGSIVFGLVSEHGQFMVGLGGPGLDGSYHANADSLDGGWAPDEAFYASQKPLLSPARRSTIVCMVRRDGFRVTCDGQEVLNWAGDFGRFTNGWPVPNPRQLFVGTWESVFHFHDLTVRPLTAEEQNIKLRPSGSRTPPPPGTECLADFEPKSVTADRFMHNQVIDVGARRYRHCIGIFEARNRQSKAVWRLERNFTTFTATVGLADYVARYREKLDTPLTFHVSGDGKELWTSKPIDRPGQTDTCDVSIEGVDVFELRISCAKTTPYAWAFWCDPLLVPAAGADKPQ